MVQIGSRSFAPALFLAPMAGVTDRDFRRIVRRIGGAGVVAMEFISSKHLVHGHPEMRRRARRMLAFGEDERPISIQIYGSDVATMVAAAREVEELGPDLVDINMGCPANAVLRGCAGAALMSDLPLARRIIRAVRRAVSVPLTVKFRLGRDERQESYVELGRICQGEGVDAVAMHGRYAKQGFRGAADWAPIARLAEALAIPVVGNGDVRTAEDARRMLAETGCSGVMVGRGATRNPWVFREIAANLPAALGTGSAGSAGRGRPQAPAPTLADRRALILDHFRTVVERDEPVAALHTLRKFTGWYSHGLPQGQRLRRRISELRDADAFFREIESFFAAAMEEALDEPAVERAA